MRLFTNFIFILFSLSIFNGCEKEKSRAREYPRLKTLAVTDINENSATFNAEVYFKGNEEIIDHGFVWGNQMELDINSDNRIFLGLLRSADVFAAKITTTLEENKPYYVRAFVKTEEHVVYGPEVSFTSLGSGAPEITGFEPAIGKWMDTILISGRNFSWKEISNQVSLNNIQCPVLFSTDTTIHLLVSPWTTEEKNIFSVTLAGNRFDFTKDTFRLLKPAVSDFFPKKVRWGDTVYVTGRHFTSPNYDFKISGTINSFYVNFILKKADTLSFIVPDGITTITNSADLRINDVNLPLPGGLELLPPYITSINPKEGTWGTPITMKGRFNARCVFTVGGINALIRSSTRDSVIIIAPATLVNHNNLIVNTVTPFTITSPDTFKLHAPVILSISPLSGYCSSTVQILGNYFLANNTSVNFGNVKATVTGVNSTLISVKVPPGIQDVERISVTVGSQTVVSLDYFTAIKPKINSIIPATGTFNDTIILQGENLSFPGFLPSVSFGTIPATVISSSDSKILIKVPANLDSIPRIINCTISCATAASTEAFTLAPPEIHSITPSIPVQGQDLIIYGTNFSPDASRNKVWWGTVQLPVKSAAPTQITVSFPYVGRGENRIAVSSVGFKIFSPLSYKIESQWLKLATPAGFSCFPGITFSLKGKGYIIDPKTGKMTSFDPSTGEFKDLGVHSTFIKLYGISSVIHRDTAYTACRSAGFMLYDPDLNVWIKLCDLPTFLDGSVLLSLNNEIYFGLAYSNNPNRKFWKYDPISKTWVTRNDLVYLSNVGIIEYFALNNAGYVLFLDKKLFRYDPTNDLWSQQTSFPLTGTYYTYCTNFVINNKVYVGLGYSMNPDIPTEFFWLYDPDLRTWSNVTRIPGGPRLGAVSFVINNKAYSGFGLGWNNPNDLKNDFYEFDPNYIY